MAVFALAAGRARTGADRGRLVLRAIARVTVVDGALAIGVPAGLVCDVHCGWRRADPAAGATEIASGLHEGVHHRAEAR